ncbi:hypothetical protein [Algoriphagus boritolerans]|uniref:Oxygen tolerance n=1 Tax=Algoriphagus boritolerans DSM 17298 = JCM 18970 TaxID=1120964 RepID=A0A1H5ZUR7_9BACT|nr:hypothetical protein [Algoriphagus boritolerans]SEG39900.1 hypothetical protein SAMN03080598_03733 [Algoriphagus boritolerans DSM 17298 = JCM 18970]
MGKIGIFLSLLLFSHSSFAQSVQVEGYFTQDSAKLGERVGFVLKARYPESSQVIFPDSTYDLSPLVLLEKKTFISQTQDGETLDSAIYYLSNFSLDPSVYLSLPVYELSRYDSITYFSNEAELKLKLTLDSIPEQPVFQENNVYQPIEKNFNWLLAALIIGGIVLLLGGFALLFAKRIKALFKRNREKIRWLQFERKWKKLTGLLAQNPALELADEVVGLWKGYMESITDLPFQEWTSSEISEALDDKEIFKALRSMDMIIYAGKEAKSEEATNYLLGIAKIKYQEKLNHIRNERATR